jgi:hypothetical protein
MRQFFLTIPDELGEAARIDGCTEWGIFWRVILPLSRPVLAVVALFHFLFAWNDFMGPLLYLTRKHTFTLALALQNYQSQHGGVQWQYLMAASAVLIIPIIVLFFTRRRSSEDRNDGHQGVAGFQRVSRAKVIGITTAAPHPGRRKSGSHHCRVRYSYVCARSPLPSRALRTCPRRQSGRCADPRRLVEPRASLVQVKTRSHPATTTSAFGNGRRQRCGLL